MNYSLVVVCTDYSLVSSHPAPWDKETLMWRQCWIMHRATVNRKYKQGVDKALTYNGRITSSTLGPAEEHRGITYWRLVEPPHCDTLVTHLVTPCCDTIRDTLLCNPVVTPLVSPIVTTPCDTHCDTLL